MNEAILIVDDERPVRAMLQGVLDGMGYRVSAVESAEKALEIVEKAPVDLVITDLKMPKIDGLELAQKLLEQDSDRPVLLMTAFADLASARQAVSVGIYEYFTKPFDINDVVAGIRRALEHRRLALEIRAYQKDLELKVEERTRQLRQKVKELEARDTLLRHLLSLQEPDASLALAVRLALDLCACDAAALYVPGPEGEIQLRMAVGFKEPNLPMDGEDRQRLERTGIAEIPQPLQEAMKHQAPLWVHTPGPVRQEFGIHSFGILPVCKGEEVIALLEVGRKRQDVLVGEADLELLQGFLPYVAMAVFDCKLQEEIPGWEEDVDEVLKAAGEWSE